MPKLFRPKLNQTIAKTIKSPIAESNVHSPSPPKICNTTQHIEEPQIVQESTYTTEDTAYEISSKPAESPVKVFTTQSPNTVDIDQPGLRKPNRKPPSQPKEPQNVEVVQLFKRKKCRTTPSKHTNELALPLPDQPLDRSSVSLNALLHWVPANKPPPSFRQERPDRSESPTLSTDTLQIKKEHPSNIKTESSIDAPPASTDSATPMDLLAPQLRLDADGNIVLDESSLLVSLPETSREDVTVRHVREETGLLNVTYNSFRTPMNRRGKRWPAREVVRFYRALSTFGRDFYLMAEMFPDRSRAELKRKFKTESRNNPYLINQALRNRRTYDITSLLPLSDDDEETDDDVPVKKNKVKLENEDGDGTRQIKRKRGRPRKVTTGQADVAPNKRNKGTALPYNPDSVLDTIEAVLARCVSPSPVLNNRSSPSSNATSSVDDHMEQPQQFPAIRTTSSLEQMIIRTQQMVQQNATDSTVPLDDEPTSISLWQSNSLELNDSPTSFGSLSEPLPLDPIGKEHPKIDILLAGRKLLGE